MGVGKRGGGALAPWILKSPAKKGCFLSFEGEKSNFDTFGPPLEKNWKNTLATPPGKNPSDAHDCKLGFTRAAYNDCYRSVVLHSRSGLPNLFSVAGHFHMRKFIAGRKRFLWRNKYLDFDSFMR